MYISSYPSDIDECATGNQCNVGGNEVYISTEGSFSCLCAVRFVNNGGTCEGKIL